MSKANAKPLQTHGITTTIEGDIVANLTNNTSHKNETNFGLKINIWPICYENYVLK